MNPIPLVRKRRQIPYAFPEDVAMLGKQLRDAGYYATDYDIVWAWERHSAELCAHWLTVHEDGHEARSNVSYLLEHLVPKDTQ